MSGKEICQKAAKIAFPQLPPEGIERVAGAIWVASRTLWHVEELAELMTEDIPNHRAIGHFVKALRNVQAVANEWSFTFPPTIPPVGPSESGL